MNIYFPFCKWIEEISMELKILMFLFKNSVLFQMHIAHAEKWDLSPNGAMTATHSPKSVGRIHLTCG